MIYQAWLLAASCLVLPAIAYTSLEKRAALDTCLSDLEVPVFASGSSNFTQAIQPFNRRVPFKPAAYAVPSTIKHIQDAVSCGVKNGVRVTAKSGGHSYGSHGLGGEDDHLVVDLRRFNNVTVDVAAHTATVGAGGRLGNIATALYNQGKQATSHGTCPGVGVGGLSLHGGYGLISRLKGLTLDNMLSANVVLANGSVVTASTIENPDLFWSLRGAGGAFGVVTSFKFMTFDAPENNLVFQYNLTPASASQLANMLSVLQNFTQTTQPPELNMRLFVPNQFTGVYYGNRSEFDKIMNPLLTQLGITSTSAGHVSVQSWLNTLTSFSNGPLAQPEIYTTQENFYAKSLMPDNLSPAALTALANYYFDTARRISRSWYLLIDMHGGSKSAVSAVAPDATAYAHRNATFKMQFYDTQFGSTTYPPEWMSFMNGWVKAIEEASPGQTFGMYVNYADTNLTKDEAHTRYWKEHHARLVVLKERYDPGKVFEGPQLVGS
ncbi:FAD-binding domain-containing protein [Setomelanomma holmii]|uniref:FAD-binding domain-containing protein n=1 Tax=Setomelanomma holmii TaxID=210430 RepID=A0A9P4LIJ6_9PLEO|nr:FAD-binding domain-containing protein [Setomelanomma holmii]